MTYPFEYNLPNKTQENLFMDKLPNISSSMPELFRTMNISYRSIEQRNMYGKYGGLRRDNGFETSLNLMWVAMLNDQIIGIDADVQVHIDTLRAICLKWYQFGNELDACLFFGYYFYLFNSQSKFIVRDQIKALKFMFDNANRTSKDPGILQLLKQSYSNAWYQSEHGIGDKISGIYIVTEDLSKVELPLPGYQITFAHSYQYDLRAPTFITRDKIEKPVIQNDKVIVSCPYCKQKCRGQLFSHLEMTCPKCAGKWAQRI
jgi:hypothetical protein